MESVSPLGSVFNNNHNNNNNEVKSEDIVDARRVGKHRLERNGSRRILVRTKSKVVRDKIMSGKSK